MGPIARSCTGSPSIAPPSVSGISATPGPPSRGISPNDRSNLAERVDRRAVVGPVAALDAADTGQSCPPDSAAGKRLGHHRGGVPVGLECRRPDPDVVRQSRCPVGELISTAAGSIDVDRRRRRAGTWGYALGNSNLRFVRSASHDACAQQSCSGSYCCYGSRETPGTSAGCGSSVHPSIIHMRVNYSRIHW